MKNPFGRNNQNENEEVQAPELDKTERDELFNNSTEFYEFVEEKDGIDTLTKDAYERKVKKALSGREVVYVVKKEICYFSTSKESAEATLDEGEFTRGTLYTYKNKRRP